MEIADDDPAVALNAMTNSMSNPRVPATISDRQFYQQLAIAGIITQDEALASNAAIIPAPLLNIIDEMPADQQFSIKMIVSGATVFERQNPLTISIGTAYGMTSDQIDAFFLAASLLDLREGGPIIPRRRFLAAANALNLLPLSGHGAHSRTCCWLAPVANGPRAEMTDALIACQRKSGFQFENRPN